MNKIAVSEATKIQLNWLVAKCQGIPERELYISGSGKWQSLFRRTLDEDGNLDGRYMTGPDLLFATKWEAGGPIIERLIAEGFELKQATFSASFQCIRVKNDEVIAGYGPTPLIAAMRCYVASKLGNEVEIPKELL